ncbi:MFS transporter [Aurantimonas endophytica]|uniref:Putative MFS family arabinose efflux permease n=1 Tax=Aurantimonas endophytica TaxID=1522175 RepID=A0A7W6HH75_9HYPH|nr:MFS transporter [Aurantimonas endophytica]MBB4005166.1 putative MFS family arabinose efflux permease [Aurantimonas endophytica]MCO6406171.1 MFS transporter [Aurantimonas endophytica]
MNGRGNLVAAGFALTALSYGLARFAYGLLLPDIREELSLGATAAGWIGGSAFAAYCFGIVFALSAGARLGERVLTVLAGLTATGGMALVAAASSGWTLGLAIALAGLSTGLTSPPLAAAVGRCLGDAARPKANGAINAGTAAGIVFSGVAVILFAGDWRGLYGLFAAVGAAVTVWLWFAMPPAAGGRASRRLSLKRLTRRGVGGLCAGAFLMGAASTAIWTFGANILRDELGFSDGGIALAWSVLGAAGIAGAATGILTVRFGIGQVHRLAVFAMVVALTGLVGAGHAPAVAFAVMGLFGVAYIVSSGAFLLWGIMLYPARPDIGLGLPFLMIALGQTAGAPLFGFLWDAAGSAAALATFAVIMASAAFWTPGQPSARRRSSRVASPAATANALSADCG